VLTEFEQTLREKQEVLEEHFSKTFFNALVDKIFDKEEEQFKKDNGKDQVYDADKKRKDTLLNGLKEAYQGYINTDETKKNAKALHDAFETYLETIRQSYFSTGFLQVDEKTHQLILGKLSGDSVSYSDEFKTVKGLALTSDQLTMTLSLLLYACGVLPIKGIALIFSYALTSPDAIIDKLEYEIQGQLSSGNKNQPKKDNQFAYIDIDPQTGEKVKVLNLDRGIKDLNTLARDGLYSQIIKKVIKRALWDRGFNRIELPENCNELRKYYREQLGKKRKYMNDQEQELRNNEKNRNNQLGPNKKPGVNIAVCQDKNKDNEDQNQDIVKQDIEGQGYRSKYAKSK